MIGNEFTLIPEILKKFRQKSWNKGFSDTRHQVIKDNDTWEKANKTREPYECLVLLLWKSIPCCGAEEWNWGKGEKTFWTAETEMSPERLRQLKSIRQSTKEERTTHRENIGNLQRVPWGIQQNIHQHLCVKRLTMENEL